MAKVKIKANKLENASVNFISLVQRGANRIPFRIIKLDKESDMLDISRVFRRKAEDTPAPTDDKKVEQTPDPALPTPPTQPTLLGVVVEKASTEAATKVFAEHGIDVTKAEEVEEGTTVFKQAEGDLDGAAIFKVGDTTLALIGDLSDEQIPATVREVVAKTGFYPSVDVVEALVQKTDENKADFEGYASLFESLVPANVRKAAEVLHVTLNPPKPVVKAEEPTPAPEPKVNDEPAPTPGLTVEQVQEIVQKAVGEATKSLQDLITQVTKGVEGLTTQVSDIKTQGDALAGKVAEVEKVAKAADESVRSVVVGSPPPEDRGDRTPVRKGDDDPRTGTFDTAFLPRQRRRI